MINRGAPSRVDRNPTCSDSTGVAGSAPASIRNADWIQSAIRFARSGNLNVTLDRGNGICTAKRQKGLANRKVHEALVKAWIAADKWLVGHYVIMPDHIHLFCAPQTRDCSIEQWITYWKREFRRICKSAPRFQPRGFHHRLRREESYAEKLDYVLNNPVRAGLVKTAQQWKFQGVLRILPWWR